MLQRRCILALGLLVFLFTLTSPLDALANGYLFSAHMLQHLLLLLVVPPLLLLARPVHNRLTASIRPQALGHPLLGWLSGVGAMWLWHAPTLCDAAATSPAVHGFQTASLLILGSLFWWPILGPDTPRRLSPLLGIAYLFTACVACTLLGIIITFAPVSVCPAYLHPIDHGGLLSLIRDRWGLTPAVDQQVGGLLMWVPACLIYLSAILGLLARWYREAEAALPPTSSAQPQLNHLTHA
jgi:cytochrome c oxidase assembly factor CtaG